MSLHIALSIPINCPHCNEEIEKKEVYSAKITHNLSKMADAAGHYQAIWKPEEIGIIKAKQLIDLLEICLEKLISNPAEYQKLNPENGWGSYDTLVSFVANYLEACRKWPNAIVDVDR